MAIFLGTDTRRNTNKSKTKTKQNKNSRWQFRKLSLWPETRNLFLILDTKITYPVSYYIKFKNTIKVKIHTYIWKINVSFKILYIKKFYKSISKIWTFKVKSRQILLIYKLGKYINRNLREDEALMIFKYMWSFSTFRSH